MVNKELYEYVKAIVDCGELSWEYKLHNASGPSEMSHDVGVEGYTDEEIIDLTCSMLDVSTEERHVVTIEYA